MTNPTVSNTGTARDSPWPPATGTARPRIAMVSTHGYVAASPPLGAADTGGQVVYVLELSKKLGELGYEVDIWTRQFEDQVEIERVDDHVRVIRVRCGGPSFIPKEYLVDHLPEWIERAIEIVKRHDLRYELLNSHYWDAGFAGQALARSLGIPHVHTPHSIGLWKRRQMERDYPADLQRFEVEYNFARRIALEREIYAAAGLVVATTPPQVDLLVSDYGVPPARCRLIPPGYDDRRFFPVSEATRQSIRARIGFSGDVVLALGRLATNKGYDLLISAFRSLADRNPNATLHLAVGGATLDEAERALLASLEQQVRDLGLLGRVRFGGFIPDPELADYYRAADVFVLSSRYEPFGMTAVEAMACGTPTVITVHGGLWRSLTFGRHALFTDPFDPEDLAMTILKPFRLPRLRVRMARMGAHKARSLFSWTGIAHQLLIAAERRAPAAIADDEEPGWEEPWNDGD
ncbi:MAG: glycosyltransferase [Deltaproteobacteria bacterium]|nr:glycosyltransferase [Deltaproteobacteria bacterium]